MRNERTGSRRRSRAASKVSATVAVLALACACGGGGGGSAADGGKQTPRIAFTSEVQPSYVNTRYGPIEYGSEFGLEFSEDDFLVFDSHSTATQTALSGRAEIVGGSFASHLLAREQGTDFKAFCPFINLDDYMFVGRDGVNSVDDWFKPETTVGVDSPGGAAAMAVNAMLQANDASGLVNDIPNTKILQSSGLRTSAFVSGEVDATIIHLSQFNLAKEQVPSATAIAKMYEDLPFYIKESFAAPADWLEQNKEVAASFCASVLQANRTLTESFETYREAVNTYVAEPPPEEELRTMFELLQQHNFWPEDGGHEPEAVQYMIDLAVTSGVLETELNAEEVVARDVLSRAREMVNASS